MDKFKRQHAVKIPFMQRNNEIQTGLEQIGENMVHYNTIL